MPLDTSIAMGYKPVQIPNQLAQYAQMQQILGGQQEQQLNALKMQEAQAAMQERNALRGLNPADADYFNQLARVNPQIAIQYRKEQTAAEQGKAAAASSTATTQKTNIDNSRSLLVGVNDQPAYDAWRAYSVSKIPELANILPAQFTPETKDSLLRTADDMSKRLTAAPEKAAPEPSDIVTMRALGLPLTQAGYQQYRDAQRQERMLSPEEEQQKIRIAAASRAPTQPRAEQPLEKVVDPVTGKVVFASREEALRGRMTPAAAMESLPPKEIQKREAAFPQATSALKGFESKSELFIRDLEQLRDDPGLNKITGPVFGRTPSASREGSRAQATYDKVFAKGGFQALQDMRDASKTGGALGNVSNKEGERLEKSIVGGLDRTQNIQDVKKSIDQLIDDIRGSKIRMREAYDDTYSYKSGSEPTAKPAPAAASNIDALLNKYR